MHTIRFFPLGNADTCLMELEDDKMLLFDFADMHDPNDDEDKRIDLAASLRKRLDSQKKSRFDVVAFTHADDDHIHGSTEFFYLQHAEKYQSDERVKIDELWVPAAMILEEGSEGEARILRAEARYRLKKGKGIRVFSRPDRLIEWLEDEGLSLDDRRHLISDAGTLVPGFDKATSGVEFFVHSPFAKHLDGGVEDRNESALIFHVTFFSHNTETKMFLIGDTTHDVLSDIVAITRAKKRTDRLTYDIYDIPHHCSAHALADDKGKEITDPDEQVKWLLEQGNDRCLLVSCSDVIPSEDTKQPPHKQAAKYYEGVAESKNGQFLVTMEHPDKNNPKPIVITIGSSGYKLERALGIPAAVASSTRAPRAG